MMGTSENTHFTWFIIQMQNCNLFYPTVISWIIMNKFSDSRCVYVVRLFHDDSIRQKWKVKIKKRMKFKQNEFHKPLKHPVVIRARKGFDKLVKKGKDTESSVFIMKTGITVQLEINGIVESLINVEIRKIGLHLVKVVTFFKYQSVNLIKSVRLN